MKGASRGVARRYSRAIFEVAAAAGTARELRPELEAAARALRGSPELERALLHPALPVQKKRSLVATVFAAGSSLLLKTLDLLTSRGRLPLLPAVAEEYVRILLESENVETAELVTAAPLPPEQAARVEVALEAVTGKGIELRSEVDPELLGGVLVKIGGRHYDGTVRGSLRALKARLASA